MPTKIQVENTTNYKRKCWASKGIEATENYKATESIESTMCQQPTMEAQQALKAFPKVFLDLLE